MGHRSGAAASFFLWFMQTVNLCGLPMSGAGMGIVTVSDQRTRRRHTCAMISQRPELPPPGVPVWLHERRHFITVRTSVRILLYNVAYQRFQGLLQGRARRVRGNAPGRGRGYKISNCGTKRAIKHAVCKTWGRVRNCVFSVLLLFCSLLTYPSLVTRSAVDFLIA